MRATVLLSAGQKLFGLGGGGLAGGGPVELYKVPTQTSSRRQFESVAVGVRFGLRPYWEAVFGLRPYVIELNFMFHLAPLHANTAPLRDGARLQSRDPGARWRRWYLC